jgi:hypothetical protein
MSLGELSDRDQGIRVVHLVERLITINVDNEGIRNDVE